MISADGIRSIFEQYERFGWRLNRVLVTPELKASIGAELDDIFVSVQATESDINAAWFTRAAKHGRTAWELRALQELPYALVEVVDDATPQEELNDALKRVEARLRERHSIADRGTRPIS